MADKILSGQVAVVSGGLGDIGRAICATLAQRGADVAFGDLAGPEVAAAVVESLRPFRVRIRYDRADVSDPDQVQRWIDEVHREFGVPTLVIPNAAIVTKATVVGLDAQQWRSEMAVNLDGAFFVAQACVRKMLDAGRPGRVVFVGSWAAHAPHTNIPAYCVTKAGLRMLCKVMALELAPHDILVNEVAPGYVDAGLSSSMFKQDPELRAHATARVPVQKLIHPDEVADHIAYLCEPCQRNITGSTLLVDGGLSLLS